MSLLIFDPDSSRDRRCGKSRRRRSAHRVFRRGLLRFSENVSPHSPEDDLKNDKIQRDDSDCDEIMPRISG